MADANQADSSTPVKPANDKLCTCYCFVSWIAPIAAPDVDDPGMPTVMIAPGPPIVETSTTTGTTYWTANVNVKTHVCNTQNVTAVAADTPNLAHNTYTITSSRTLGPTIVTIFGRRIAIGPRIWFGLIIGTWGPWTPPVRVNGAVLPAATALASTSPPMTPLCTTLGIPCP